MSLAFEEQSKESFASFMERCEWTPYAESLLTRKASGRNVEIVHLTALVSGEGYLTLSRIDFEVIREGDAWKIERWQWGDDIDLPIPADWHERLWPAE
ncbi:MAG: hypothetical protein GC168_18495 [Candidatus Hydrogenedens sp.]|nr:hypothetical protein [Candidatus Hydrogenedens sp.]